MSAAAMLPSIGGTQHGRALGVLAGRRVLVLNWRDIRHPQAGGAEVYVHEIVRRWVAAGVGVTLLTARAPGMPEQERIDGIEIRRAGGALSVYPRTAARLLRWGDRFDAVLDCQNGVPFFAPLSLGPRVPVIQLVHHVHQDQFAGRFPAGVAAVGRALEGPVARRVYGRSRSVAVSPSTRQEMRARLGFDGIVDVVPNGGHTGAVVERRPAAVPTVVVVSRLVPHKRIDLLLDAVGVVRSRLPDLHVDVVGTGPELASLWMATAQRPLGRTVTFHGRASDAVRDRLMAGAWLTTSTSAGEGWGCSVLEAAAAGVPCVALRAPGIRDSVIHGRTGWLVDAAARFADDLHRALLHLADPSAAEEMAADCRAWASFFTWDRSAELLAATLVAEMQRRRHTRLGLPGRRDRARSDTTTAAWFTHPDPASAAARLRVTDEIRSTGTAVTAVLRGCDDVRAIALLEEVGATDIRVRPASRHEILGGPAALDPSGWWA
jgi:glycosyltransferase involved in cell wall biosynthesis